VFHVFLTVGPLIDEPNRPEGFDDDSSKEHHVQRSRALHDILDGDPLWTVRDWGTTDDELPHDYVELILELKKGPANLPRLDIPALDYIGKVLNDSGLSIAEADGVKRLVATCRNGQQAGQIVDFSLALFDEVIARVGCSPAGYVWITLRTVVRVPYNAACDQVSGLGTSTLETIDVPTSLVPFVQEMILQNYGRAPENRAGRGRNPYDQRRSRS
jgi:hypothetical protein